MSPRCASLLIAFGVLGEPHLSVAELPPQPDVDAMERQLAERGVEAERFALIWSGSVIYADVASARASDPRTPTPLDTVSGIGGYDAKSRQVWVARVVGSEDDVVEIETLTRDERKAHCYRRGQDVARVRGFVHRSALAPASVERTRVSHEDGTWAELNPGVLVAQPQLARRGGWAVDAHGLTLELSIPADAVALTYTPEPHFDVQLDVWGDSFTPPPETIAEHTLLFLDSSAWIRGADLPWTLRPIESVEESPRGDLIIEVGERCLRLGLLAEDRDVVGRVGGVGGIGGLGRKSPPPDRYRVPEGAALYWSEAGQQAGVLLRDQTLTYEPVTNAAGLRCLKLPITTHEALCVQPEDLKPLGGAP